MLGEALGTQSYIMMLEEMPESVFVDMDTGDVDVCEEKSHKNSLSGIYDGFRGQERNRKGESFVIPVSEWFGHFVGELIELLSPVDVGKREKLEKLGQQFSGLAGNEEHHSFCVHYFCLSLVIDGSLC